MNLKKVIIGFLLTTISFGALASNIAIVSSKVAVIYADAKMSVPIGKINAGTKIKIGDKQLNMGRTAVSTYQNRLVYIPTKDLRIAHQKDDIGQLASRYKAKEERELLKRPLPHKQYFYLGGGLGSLDSEWKDLAKLMQSDKDQVMTSAYIGAILNPHQSRFSFTIEFGGGKTSDTQIEIENLLIDSALHYSFFRTSLLELNVFAGPIISPYFTIYTEDRQYKTKGAGWGYTAGGEATFFKNFKYSLTAGGKYRYLKLTGHDDVQLLGQYRQTTKVSSLGEFQLYARLNVEF